MRSNAYGPDGFHAYYNALAFGGWNPSRRAWLMQLGLLVGGFTTGVCAKESSHPPCGWLDLAALPQSEREISPRARSSRDHTSSRLVQLLVWPQHWLQLVVKYQQNPLRAARACSYLLVTMRDAWHASMHLSHSPLLAEACLHRAATAVLQHLYPYESAGSLEALRAWAIKDLRLDSAETDWCDKLGQQVAQAAIDRSLRDGAGRTWPISNRPADFNGIWQPSYPLYAVNPTEGYAGEWRPWVRPSAQRYMPPAPAKVGSPEHDAQAQEVLRVSKSLKAEEKDAALRWHLDQGSVTPPGVWMDEAMRMVQSSKDKLSLPAVLEVLSLLAVAMHDALIACWKVKFEHWTERPITTIRRRWDPSFEPLLITPGFPSYVSGHACVSAAAAGILRVFWPQHTEGLNAMAKEAAMSRLWGGIHFSADNDEGLALGVSVAQDVLTARSGCVAIASMA